MSIYSLDIFLTERQYVNKLQALQTITFYGMSLQFNLGRLSILLRKTRGDWFY